MSRINSGSPFFTLWHGSPTKIDGELSLPAARANPSAGGGGADIQGNGLYGDVSKEEARPYAMASPYVPEAMAIRQQINEIDDRIDYLRDAGTLSTLQEQVMRRQIKELQDAERDARLRAGYLYELGVFAPPETFMPARAPLTSARGLNMDGIVASLLEAGNGKYPPQIEDLIAGRGKTDTLATGMDVYEAIANSFARRAAGPFGLTPETRRKAERGGRFRATDLLARNGVPGIANHAGVHTVFDDKFLRVLSRGSGLSAMLLAPLLAALTAGGDAKDGGA